MTSASSVSPARATPGTTGTSKAATAFLAAILSPITSIARAGGPRNTTRARSHAAAKSAFSARNP
ncbi:Uncharacterised protein [Mycobacterium tuberculosis]|uniref:Uncharacterized protein n=1 Tax=Mycobacterium tuberculosis TaxID=1773 RepID=A0A655JL58_MYCTX|nr:Uncharacterised protein [Mycobacterium tuberculosis]CKT29432.1 Uncharacterised protein [Mycobacterium tuberculosis]COX12916.1 Uncharacterised protein [Mycobacterium tuberculosis]COX79663.1 Uncharacterised protein [Mycobacterium tuberculosis]CPB02208.1 Uncharacterised protein [Mycobacterium tuberculosis]